MHNVISNFRNIFDKIKHSQEKAAKVSKVMIPPKRSWTQTASKALKDFCGLFVNMSLTEEDQSYEEEMKPKKKKKRNNRKKKNPALK